MDEMILKTQQWLNTTYGNDSRYVRVTEDGFTGWGTINGLTRALQIELGIATTADSFGPTTISKFKTRYPNGIAQQEPNATYEDNIFAIIQGALWCKGYSTGSGEITRHFYGGTGAGVKLLKNDAGVDDSVSTVTLDVMQALLSMNQYKNLWRLGGNSEIRSIQQDINQNYRAYVGLAPCDGLYSRDMNKALIKVLQAVEGLSPTDATGNFGATTKSKCPILPNGANVTDSNRGPAIRLMRYALCCNGLSTGSISTTWDTSISDKINTFQAKYAINVNGNGDINTWMALLLSSGNPDRSSIGCDCSTILNAAKANALYSAGYRYVGRYLTGTVGSNYTPKNLSITEMEAIFAAGLKIFAIYQDNNPSVGYFTKAQGEADAANAIAAAQELKIPYHEVIFFAVDFDAMDYQITSNIIPYFQGIHKIVKSHRNAYKIGVYGSRNVCSRVNKIGLAVSSFVGDMSTGYSGNMGYSLPDNWAFDQFREYTFQCSDGPFGLDKDAYSGKYSGFNTFEDHSNNPVITVPTQEIYLERYRYLLSLMKIKPSAELTLNQRFSYSVGNIKIEYEAGTAAAFEEKGYCKYTSVTVANGEISNASVSASIDLYNNLSAEAKTEVDDDGTLKYSVSFENEIENGTVKYGVGTDTEGNLIVDYNIEEILWTTDQITYKLYSNITLTINNDSSYQTEYESVLAKIPTITDEQIISIVRVVTNALMKALILASVVAIIIIVFMIALIPVGV